jgi:Putative Ig domain/Ricin-type beta-trefoil lectin domain
MIKRVIGGGMVVALGLLGLTPAASAQVTRAGHTVPPHLVNLHQAFERALPHVTPSRIGGVTFPRGLLRAGARAAATAGASCSEPDCPLTYNGGPVQHQPHVYLLLWGPHWQSDSAQAASASFLEKFYAGLGVTPDDSWSTITSQYGDGSGSPGFGSSVYEGVWNDTSTPPAGVDETQLGAEADAFASNHGITDLADAQIVIATQSGTCPQDFYAPSCSGGSGYYCAWHSESNEPFTNLPYLPDAGSGCGANYVSNADDGFSIVGGHEYAETITDPGVGDGWWDASDSSGGEIGDKCAWTGIGTVTLSTGTFAMQPLYSNSDYTKNGHGCVLSGTSADSVSVTSPGSQTTPAGTPVSLQIKASSSTSAALTYKASGLPGGLSIDPATGKITGTPATPGGSTVTVTVTDTAKASGTATFSWAVTAAFSGVHVTGYKGRCLATSNGGMSSGTGVALWWCGAHADQLWAAGPHGALRLSSGECVTDPSWGKAGTKLLLRPCNGKRNQQWSYSSNGEYVLSSPHLCLTDPGYATRNGSRLTVAACHDYKNQRWSKA